MKSSSMSRNIQGPGTPDCHRHPHRAPSPEPGLYRHPCRSLGLQELLPTSGSLSPGRSRSRPLCQHPRAPPPARGLRSRAPTRRHDLLCSLIPTLSLCARQAGPRHRQAPTRDAHSSPLRSPHKRPLWTLPPRTQPCRIHAPRRSGHPASAGASERVGYWPQAGPRWSVRGARATVGGCVVLDSAALGRSSGRGVRLRSQGLRDNSRH